MDQISGFCKGHNYHVEGLSLMDLPRLGSLGLKGFAF